MNTQTHNIPSLADAIDFSKSKNWSESCSSFSIGTLVQIVGGKVLNEGYLFGRVVKETSKFIWIYCANGKTQQKSKKYVELAHSRQQDTAASIIPRSVPSVDVSQTSRQQDTAASIIPRSVPSVDVSQTSRQPLATLSSDPNVSFGERKNEKRKRCADAQDRRIILSKKNGNRLNVNVRKKPRLDKVINWGKSVPSFSSGSASFTPMSPAVNKKSATVLRKTPGHQLKGRSVQKYSKKKNSPLVKCVAREANGFDFSASREKLSASPRSKTYDAIRFDFGLKIEYNQSPTNLSPRGRSSKREFVNAARAILDTSAAEERKVTVSAPGQIPPPPGFSPLGQNPLLPGFANGVSVDEKGTSRATVRPKSGFCPMISSEKKKSTRDEFDSIFGI